MPAVLDMAQQMEIPREEALESAASRRRHGLLATRSLDCPWSQQPPLVFPTRRGPKCLARSELHSATLKRRATACSETWEYPRPRTCHNGISGACSLPTMLPSDHKRRRLTVSLLEDFKKFEAEQEKRITCLSTEGRHKDRRSNGSRASSDLQMEARKAPLTSRSPLARFENGSVTSDKGPSWSDDSPTSRHHDQVSQVELCSKRTCPAVQGILTRHAKSFALPLAGLSCRASNTSAPSWAYSNPSNGKHFLVEQD